MRFIWQGILYIVFLFSFAEGYAQSFKFAHVTDTHIGGATGADDLRRTVNDLNNQEEIDFVILSGDITEFGADAELKLAKQILDSLQLPWYVIPGNHDGNWSENGANTFRTVFGGETFFFRHKGFMFMGTNSGPNMRMSPGQIPRENLVWMDSVFKANPDTETPLIYINHYPQDSSLNNWYEAIDRIKQRNVQLALCGHGHANMLYDWEGIPGVMGRSNLRAKDSIGGYNIVTVSKNRVSYQVKKPGEALAASWAEIELRHHHFLADRKAYPRPSFQINTQYQNQVRVNWTFEDASDIGTGMAYYDKLLITANTAGQVIALNINTGERVWRFATKGKVYSTPAVWKDIVVVGSSDHFIYGVNARTGALLWELKTAKAVLGSPVIDRGIAYIGGSDGTFRAVEVKSGKVKWVFDKVKGYVSTLPTIAADKVIFGSWGNGFYALNKYSGALEWEWNNGHANRMFSAAACYPVVSNERVFIVAPDRYMTALDLETGKVIWREKKDPFRVRESMGVSKDGKTIYVKTMDGELLGISPYDNTMQIVWKSKLQLPYELSPSALVSNGNYVFVPSHSGLVSAVNAQSGEVAWQYKVSNGMVNPILISKKNSIIVSTMDGKIISLSYQP